MTLPRVLLALVLLWLPTLLAPGAVAQPQAEPFKVTPPEGDLRTTFRFEAPATLVGPELLRDVAFAEGPPAWEVFEEVGAETRVRASEGVAYLSSGPAARQGTVFLRQEVPVRPGWIDFSVHAALVEGNASRGVLLFRQHDAAGGRHDELAFFDLEPIRTEVRAAFPVRQGVHQLDVLLRYEMLPGQQATVAFDAPTLRQTPRLEWSFGQDAPPARGAAVERAFPRAGSYNAMLAADGAPVGTRVVRVLDRPPVADFRLVRLDEGWFLDGRGSRDPDARELLRNGAFARRAAGWTLEAPEIANDSTMEVVREEGRDVLRVSTGPQHPAGSVWAYQEVLGAAPGMPLEFRVDVRDDGDHDGYAIVLREVNRRGAADTLVRAEALGDWQSLYARWTPTPNATRLYVQLRYLAPADREVSVDFANASLTPALSYRWSLQGRAAGTDPMLAWPPSLRIPRDVRLAVTDAGGASASLNRTLDAPPVVEGWPGPTLVRAHENVTWSAADVRFTSIEAMRNGGFEREARGWGFDAAEVGGNATLSFEPGPNGLAARVDFNATQNGTLHLTQRVPIRGNESYDFSFLRRDEGARGYSVLLRELGSSRVRFRSPPWEDTTVLLPASPGWQPDLVRWKPRHNDSTHVLVHLRAVLQEGDAGAVWFDNASFQPTRQVRWALDGQDRGPQPTLRLTLPPGPHELNLSLRSGAIPRVNLSLPVYAFDPAHVSLHPALDGAIRATWRFPEDSPAAGVVLTHDGGRVEVAGRSGSHAFASPPPDATYALDVLAPGQPPLRLANGTYRPGFFAELANLTPATPTRGDDVRLVARVHDPSVVGLVAVVDGEEVPLARGEDGNWTGTWRAPLVRGEGDASLVLRGRDAEGREGATPAVAVPVDAYAGGASPLPWLGLVALAGLVAWLAPVVMGVVRSRRGG